MGFVINPIGSEEILLLSITSCYFTAMGYLYKQDACYARITRDAKADSFIPTVCFAD